MNLLLPSFFFPEMWSCPLLVVLPLVLISCVCGSPSNVTATNATSMTTIPYRWMNSTVTVTDYYLVTLADSSAQVSVKLDLRHPNPELLHVVLTNPNGWSVFLGSYSSGAVVPCPDFYVTTFQDGQDLQVLPQSQNQNISCPPPAALTPIGSCEYYTLAYDHCYPIIPPTNFPFGYRFNYVPVMGEWSLQVFSNSSLNGTLASWELIVQWDMTPFMYYGGDYLVALGVGVLFFVVSSAFLFVKKRSQFLWFTSLPCLALHLAYFTLVLFLFLGTF